MRRFYIHSSHAGCENDPGWLVMVTKDTKCGWGKNCGDKPCFLYSKKKTAAVWSNADGKNHTTLLSRNTLKKSKTRLFLELVIVLQTDMME